MDNSGKTRKLSDDYSSKSRDETIIITNKSQWQRRLRKAAAGEADSLQGKHSFTLVIRNMAEHISLADEEIVILGRSDLESGFQPTVDLTPYGAQEHGVSRQHAQLQMHNERLYITDLGSANGTYVAGKATIPHQAQVLHGGDDLLLGHLAMRVEFD
jgi:hypothetical protein